MSDIDKNSIIYITNIIISLQIFNFNYGCEILIIPKRTKTSIYINYKLMLSEKPDKPSCCLVDIFFYN